MTRARVGYRGRALLFLSFVWVGVGLTLLTDPDPDPYHKYPLEYLPIWLRVAIWWASSLVALVAAFWPPKAERWGFVALSLPAAFRAVSYAVVGLFVYPVALIGAVVWAGVVGYVVSTSSWPEPPDVTHLADES